MEKVIRNGNVAVLVSPGYGAGWYSWNQNYEELLFAPELVELVESGRASEITKELVNDLLGIDVYTGGAHSLRIEWLPVGTAFKIDEYDGSESIETLSDLILKA